MLFLFFENFFELSKFFLVRFWFTDIKHLLNIHFPGLNFFNFQILALVFGFFNKTLHLLLRIQAVRRIIGGAFLFVKCISMLFFKLLDIFLCVITNCIY